MTKIFKKIPPEELFNRILLCFGLHGINDEKEFTKHDIKIETLDLILPELEPYYTKDKKFMVTRPMEPKYYIQILRNLCNEYKLIFHSTITDSGSKYKILNPQNVETNFYYIIKKYVKDMAHRSFIISFT
jgi:hypothetical protein